MSNWTTLLNIAATWGPGLSGLAMVLFWLQRGWVAYLKYRGADYLRAKADYLAVENEAKAKEREHAVVEQAFEITRLHLEVWRAELALEQRKLDKLATTKAGPAKESVEASAPRAEPKVGSQIPRTASAPKRAEPKRNVGAKEPSPALA